MIDCTSEIMRLLVQLLLLVLVVEGSLGGWREPCGSYGCPHQPRYEPFVPAPPGHTPHCAKPGQTFCETLEHYPKQLIKFLVDKCSYDFSSILRDESHYGFNVYRGKPDYNRGYVYPRQEVQKFYSQPTVPSSYPIVSQSPVVYGAAANDSGHEGYEYRAPADNQHNPLLLDNLTQYQGGQTFPPEWLTNKHTRRETTIPNRSHRENPFLPPNNHNRAKRQAPSEVISLCETNSQYLMPRAALNNRGNWMYVVNLPETREKYSQLVKTETCSTTTCNGLCSLPEGYVSRCEQQYVQKRLVALEGSGDRLYTDVFWFPHGCACQVVQNF
ncbi:protein spaetzle 5 [Diachasma alloeum]|uniref:protein spaetzle 5 n=1 Tax=Diachasma alloeum TaxID=454923 RepID=UPI0007384549|nr:protein spaetzle 5 [Diachasma alloeum]